MLAAVGFEVVPLLPHQAVALQRVAISLSEHVHRGEELGHLVPLLHREPGEPGGRSHVDGRRKRLGVVDRPLAWIVPQELKCRGDWWSTHSLI